MTRPLFALTLTLTLAALGAAPAAQAAQCGDRAGIVAHLTGKYGETRRGIGLARNNAVVEVFASDSGSWTITVTRPDGRTCLVASGQGYSAVEAERTPPGNPA